MDNLKGIFAGKRKSGIEQWCRSFGISSDMAKSLLESIENPEEVPFLLASIQESFGKLRPEQRKEVRNALIRVQLGLSAGLPADPVIAEKQLFVTQALEKLLFGDNLFLKDDIHDDVHHSRKRGKKR